MAEIEFILDWYWSVVDDKLYHSIYQNQLRDWVEIVVNKCYNSKQHRFKFCETFDGPFLAYHKDKTNKFVIFELEENDFVVLDASKQITRE